MIIMILYAMNMKPQDVLVLLKIHFWFYRNKWTIREIANSIFISKSEVNNAINRMIISRLIDKVTLNINVNNLEKFIINGLSYVFPARISDKSVKGIPTAYSASPLKDKIISSDNDIVVWPFKDGPVIGKELKPLHPAVPKAVLQDSQLYEFFTLLDALRIGKTREVEISKKEIHKRLFNK